MSRIIVLLALVLIALVQAKIKTEEKVLVLDDDNFEEVRRIGFSGTRKNLHLALTNRWGQFSLSLEIDHWLDAFVARNLYFSCFCRI